MIRLIIVLGHPRGTGLQSAWSQYLTYVRCDPICYDLIVWVILRPGQKFRYIFGRLRVRPASLLLRQ